LKKKAAVTKTLAISNSIKLGEKARKVLRTEL
jgi:hypothetical protein